MEGGGGQGGGQERGTSLPSPSSSLLSHGGHRHDISNPQWDWLSGHARCPPPTLHTSLPSLPFSPLPAWTQCLAGRLGANTTICVRDKSPSEGEEGKRSASHGPSQEQGLLPPSLCPTPCRPQFWLGGGGMTPVSANPPPHSLLIPKMVSFLSELEMSERV